MTVTRLIGLVVAAAVACWALAASSTYVSDWADGFADGFIGCQILLAGLALLAVFQRRWLGAALCFVPVLLIALPTLGVSEPLATLQNTGFRFHASPVDQYLSTCKLLTISEDDKLQQLGRCESLSRWGSSRLDIVYDTTGKTLWPADRTTPEWQAAMLKLFPDGWSGPAHRHHLIGNFYAVETRTDDVKE